MNEICGFDSPFGCLLIYTSEGTVVRVGLPGDEVELVPVEAVDPFGRMVQQQLQAYFEDPRRPFALPLAQAGTPFQQRVWGRLQEIPSGTTLTYGELARELDTSPRALGNACRANPCPILVPCHRVLGTHGLGGYAGAVEGPRLAIKRWLLAHEGSL